MTHPISNQVKILHVAQTAHGGVGTYLEEVLAMQVRRHGSDCVRVVLPQEHAAFFPGLDSQCLLPYRSGTGRIGSSLRMVVEALSAVQNWKPDVVHLHATFAGFAMRPLLALLPGGPPVVYCAHGWAFERRKISPVLTLSMATAERLLARLCAAVVCVSKHEASRAEAVGIPSGRLKVIASGLADRKPQADALDDGHFWPPRRLRVLFVGRLDHEKGADVLLAAMKMLGERAFAVLVGSAVVSGFKQNLPDADNIRFMGWLTREQLMPLYASADILVVPSRYEAFGLAAVEGMRAGLPVIASRVGGLQELIVDRVTGRLVDAEDPWQLATAISSMNQTIRTRMGAKGRQRFLDGYRIERAVDELDGVYRDAVARTRPFAPLSRSAES